MVEEKQKGYRLNKVMKEFNLGNDTIVSFLKGKGHSVSDNMATSKLSQEQYDLLVKEFSGEKRLKERVEQIKGIAKDIKSGTRTDATTKADDSDQAGPTLTAQDLKSNMTQAAAKGAVRISDVLPATVEPTTEAKPEAKAAGREAAHAEVLPESKVSIPAETRPAEEEREKSAIKVVGKIDLDNLGKKKAAKAEVIEPEVAAPQIDLFGQPIPVEAPPKKGKKAKAEPAVEVAKEEEPVPVVAEQPAAITEVISETVVEVPLEAVAPTIEEELPESVIRARDNTPKLGGLKIMGKINLEQPKPQARPGVRRDGDTRPQQAGQTGGNAGANTGANQGSNQASANDASRQKRKRKSATSNAPIDVNRGPAGDRKGPAGGKPPRTTRREEPSTREVTDNLRATLSGMNQGPRRVRQKLRRDKRDVMAAKRDAREQERIADQNVLEVTEFLTANELANLMNVTVNDVIAKCMELGMFVSINQRINAELIQLIAEEFGYSVKFLSLEESFETDEEYEEDGELSPRAPIVTVMGHVDHGKTSLLDYIRKTNVIAGEAGGITQHIGAYEVNLDNGRTITFLDTPGHEAFTAMRARGAQVTDIAIIVIAADDQVMPQTREAINHAQAAGVPMVFAINKIDKPGANTEKIKEQLAGMNILVEDWGGKFQCQHISAKQGVGITELLDKVLLEAEILDLKANPSRPARGVVIEAQLDKGRGVVATLLVQTGTMRVGDILVANNHYGRIKAMTDERGKRLTEAGPASPAQVLGLDGVPQAGDKFQVMEEEREARELVSRRGQLLREQSIRSQKHLTLEDIARRRALGDFRQLNVIVKADVDGSAEALSDSLLKLGIGEVEVSIVLKSVGQITESDVLLASASDAIIIGFNVRPSTSARKIAEAEGVQVKLYSIIYDAINDVKDALEGLLAPTVQEELLGAAEVREVFRISKVGTVAGCKVVDGKISRVGMLRLVRDGIVVYTGKVLALKRFKNDVKDVAEGFECGISIEGYNDIREGDVIECFTTVEVKRTLA